MIGKMRDADGAVVDVDALLARGACEKCGAYPTVGRAVLDLRVVGPVINTAPLAISADGVADSVWRHFPAYMHYRAKLPAGIDGMTYDEYRADVAEGIR